MTVVRKELPKAIGMLLFLHNRLTGNFFKYYGHNSARFVGELVGHSVERILIAKDDHIELNLQLYVDMGNIVSELPRPLPNDFSLSEIALINEYGQGKC